MKRNAKRITNAWNFWQEHKHEVDEWSFTDWLRRSYGITYTPRYDIIVYDQLKYTVFVLKFG